MEELKATLDWCGYPKGGAYWWNNKRPRPRIPPFPGSDELVRAWAAVRGTVEVPAGLSPAEADKLVRTTPGIDLR